MIVIAQIALLLFIGIGIGFFGAMLVATIMDWQQARRANKNRVWTELQRTNYESRRPAAK
jgi:hypothetical protein